MATKDPNKDLPKDPKITRIPAAKNDAKPVPLPQDVDQNQLQVFVQALRTVKRPLTAAPTATPQNFLQQFEVYENGATRRLYVFVGATWRYVALT